MIYKDVKDAILKDGSFLRESDDVLLKRWFWAGVAAVVQVADVKLKNTSSNSDYAKCQHIFRLSARGVVECKKCGRRYLLD